MPVDKSIGIKRYNDDFIPIIKSNEINVIKKVILTTIKSNQEKAILELYEGTGDKCIENEYLGKLELKINKNSQKGEPNLELNLRLGDDGIIYAKAWDSAGNVETELQIEHTFTKTILPEKKHVKETYESFEESSDVTEIGDDIDYNYYEKQKEPGKILLPIILVAALLLTAGLIVLSILFFRKPISQFTGNISNKIVSIFNKKTDKDNDLISNDDSQDTPIDNDFEDITDKENITDNNMTDNQNDTNKNNEVIGIRDKEGETYVIKWGDNLWNISKTYYNNPWYYPSLAEYNEIINPRKIFAGSSLILPPKSKLRPFYPESK